MSKGLDVGSDEIADLLHNLPLAYPWAAEAIGRDYLFYADHRPIRFGNIGDKAGIDLDTVPLTINNEGYWTPPRDLYPHMRSAAIAAQGKLRRPSEGETGINPNFADFPVGYDASLADREVNDTVRVAGWADSGIVLEKANYLDQVATNISTDRPIAVRGDQTFRMLDNAQDALKPFEDCLQANSLGVAALVVDRNWVPILARRELTKSEGDDADYNELAVMPKGWHCFTSGVLEWRDQQRPSQTQYGPLHTWIRNGLNREIEEETGFRSEEGLYRLIPYAFARELKRGGKPQIFVLVKFALTVKEILDKMGTRNPTSAHEYANKPPAWNTIFSVYSGKQASRRRMTRTWSRLALPGLTRDTMRKFLGEETGLVTYEAYASLFLAAERLKENPEWTAL